MENDVMRDKGKPAKGMLVIARGVDDIAARRYEISEVLETCALHGPRGCVHYAEGGFDDLALFWSDYSLAGWAHGYAPSPSSSPKEPGVGVMKPASGQRWRDMGPGGVAPWYGGQAFTLTKPTDPKEGYRAGGWHDDKSTSPWVADSFVNGRLVFVDAGPTPTSDTLGERPRCDRCGKPPAPGKCLCKQCDDELEAEVAPKPLGPGHTFHMHGELVHPSGRPLSALQSIQARKPPEPWRPSVDEHDLLPDAGTSWSLRDERTRSGREP